MQLAQKRHTGRRAAQRPEEAKTELSHDEPASTLISDLDSRIVRTLVSVKNTVWEFFVTAIPGLQPRDALIFHLYF